MRFGRENEERKRDREASEREGRTEKESKQVTRITSEQKSHQILCSLSRFSDKEAAEDATPNAEREKEEKNGASAKRKKKTRRKPYHFFTLFFPSKSDPIRLKRDMVS